MPALLPGFEYDIFISYRQNDNRSGWVVEFVKALQEELASTIKAPVSVYFDSNPYDGLLETHNVDKSLEGKLKCLIFIPIISQTYCDTESFAWQQEFLAFNKLAKEDQLGKDIRLNNGNVASRILPVKIHDLDADDKALLEKELGGALRAVEFIFRSAGVNRPLRLVEEHAQDNQNKTFYRDQVNKVANAVKEIIHAIKKPTASSRQPGSLTVQPAPASKRRKVLAIAAALILLGSLAGYFLYGKFLPASNANLGNSIAVLYFDNISSEPGQDYFSDGITEEITAHLSSINGLRVTSRTSVIAYKGKGKATNIREIAEELNVDNVLEGSVRKSGDKLRITAQLIDARNDRHIWTEVYDRDLTDVFKIQSEIAHALAEKFKVSISPQSAAKIESIPTRNIKAYELYLKGKLIPWGTGGGIGTYFGGMEQAERLFKQAIALDPNFAQAYAMLSEVESYKAFTYQRGIDRLNMDSATYYAKEAILRNPRSAAGYVQLAKTYAYVGDFKNAVQWFYKAAELDSVAALNGAGELYIGRDGRQAIKIYSQLIKINPMRYGPYVDKAKAYLYLNQEDSVKKYSGLALALAPEATDVYQTLLQQARINGDIKSSQEFAKRYFMDDTLSYNKEMGITCMLARKWPEARRYYLRTHYRDMDWGVVLLHTGQVDSGMAVLKKVGKMREQVDDLISAGRIYAAVGNKKKALALLLAAQDSYDYNVNFLKNDPFTDNLKQEPEFKAFLAAIEKRCEEQMKGIKEDEGKRFSLEF
jgi:TolB-like protein